MIARGAPNDRRPLRMQLTEIFAHAGRAAFWGTAAKWFDIAGSALSFLVMARLIGPDNFGVFGLALLVLIVPETIVSGALSESLIQRQDLRPGHVSGAALLQVTLALTLAAGLIASSSWLAATLGHQELRLLIPLLAATLPLLALAAAPAALVQREFRFRAIAAVDAAGTATAAIVGLWLALAGFGVWSLAWMEAARRTIRTAGFLIATRWPYTHAVKLDDIRELIGFNITILATRMLSQADSAIPRLFLGLVSASALGYFNLAQRIFQQGSAVFIAPFNGVALPLASRIQHQPGKLHVALDGAGRIATLIGYPVFLGAAAITPTLVPLIMGAAWAPATLTIQIMLLLGVRAATASFNGGVLRAVGKPGMQLAIVAVGVGVGLAFSPLAAQWGAAAIAALFVARGLLTWMLGAALLERAIGYPAKRQFTIGWESMLSASIMAAAILASQHWLHAVVSGWVLAPALIVMGASIYGAAMYVLAPSTIRLLGNIALALFKRDKGRVSELMAAWAQPA
jgi:O-antigen/teichoic acid export membrane protein